MTKVAIVLCNLGGPDSLKSVKPFLQNLFADPAILLLPQPFRWLLGKWIVFRRLKEATNNYKLLGGSSPLLKETKAQAEALLNRLNERADKNIYKTFISMRYWHPMSPQVVKEVKDWQPDKVIILPLYPQFSTTTSESSILDWKQEAMRQGLHCPHVAVRSYFDQTGWVYAVAKQVEKALNKIEEVCELSSVRVIFSAHGLPQSIVDNGDPYPEQVKATVDAVVHVLNRNTLDWSLAYQSRVGPQKWIEPYLETTLMAAGKESKSVIIVPIAFVSEHSETLVELDIEYAEKAEEFGIKNYMRIPTVSIDPNFIGGLLSIIDESLICFNSDITNNNIQKLKIID